MASIPQSSAKGQISQVWPASQILAILSAPTLNSGCGMWVATGRLERLSNSAWRAERDLLRSEITDFVGDDLAAAQSMMECFGIE